MRAALILVPLIALATPALGESNRATGEEQLAKALAGRVAGAPVDCIRLRGSDSMDAIGDTAYVFDQGGVVYVNRTRDPSSIEDDSTLVIKHSGSGSQLCRHDQVTAQERFSGAYAGNVFLSEFVPYRRVK